MKLDKPTCEEIIRILIKYSENTKEEFKAGIEISCLVIQVAANTNVEIPNLSGK